MNTRYLVLLIAFICFSGLYGQKSINATLVDSVSQKSIPYATITLNDKYGVISNEVGQFQIHIKREISRSDSIMISCMGYESKHLAVENFKDSIILIQPKVFELNEVLVTDKKYTVDEIMELVRENLDQNYDVAYQKNKIFFRESYFMDILKSDVDIKKTTIPELNQEFIDSLIRATPKHNDFYTEILGDIYGQISDEKPQKLDIIKASQLYDKNNEITFEGFEERFNEIITKRVKRDSYFKIKSGLFGTKEEMDTTFYDKQEVKQSENFLEEQKKKEIDEKKSFLKYRKKTITELQQNTFIFEDTDLNFIHKYRKYKFELDGFAFINDNYVYKIYFEPKRGADYKGVIYVNLLDFGIEKVDYENIKPLKKFSLLGLSYSMDLHKGTLLYAKNQNSQYVLKFGEVETGFKMGIKRPLKIIEKNKNVKGRRKQNEISGDIHFIVLNTTKKELVLFETNQIEEQIYTDFQEKAEVKPSYLPKYDPAFWEGHNVIEPNQAIKDFKSLE